jgi:hypothetical protein
MLYRSALALFAEIESAFPRDWAVYNSPVSNINSAAFSVDAILKPFIIEDFSTISTDEFCAHFEKLT